MYFVNKSNAILNVAGRLIDPKMSIFIDENTIVKYKGLIQEYYSKDLAVITENNKELSLNDITNIKPIEIVKATVEPDYKSIVNEINEPEEESEPKETEPEESEPEESEVKIVDVKPVEEPEAEVKTTDVEEPEIEPEIEPETVEEEKPAEVKPAETKTKTRTRTKAK